MKRSEYLQTAQGQLRLRGTRRLRHIHFALTGHEPKKKSSMSDAEKLAFQGALEKAMKVQKRKYFRSPVALELEYQPTQNDPPSAHEITKNYLDLLETPVPSFKTRRKHLLFENDRQIQYLSVKYRILPRDDEPEPTFGLRAAAHSDFLEDCSLLQRIEAGGIEGADDDVWRDITDEYRRSYLDDDAVDRLRELESEESAWVTQFGQDAYDAWHEMMMTDVQTHFLRTLALTPSRFGHLLSPFFAGEPSAFESIHEASRRNLISTPLTIDLAHSNLKEGESKIYKQFVRDTMSQFRTKYSRLFPLKTQVGITILFQPPASGGIDLDNLARRIVPFVNDELAPPSDNLRSIDVSKISDAKNRAWYTAKQDALKRLPRHSITHYQVVQLPRLTTDGDDGFVRLVLEPGERFETLWSKVEGLVDKWEETVGS